MGVGFPVYLRQRDDGAVFRCGSTEEIEHQIERNDVVNDEFEAWDVDGKPLRLEVQDGCPWIRLVPQAVDGDRGFIADAIRSYAEKNNIDIDEDKLKSDDLDSALSQIRNVLEARWKKLNPLQRLLRRL
jgi:hypothetical protein